MIAPCSSCYQTVTNPGFATDVSLGVASEVARIAFPSD
jgi:hypothetical protein